MDFSTSQNDRRHGTYTRLVNVQNSDGDGKSTRRGPNYVIALSDDGDMFRAKGVISKSTNNGMILVLLLIID